MIGRVLATVTTGLGYAAAVVVIPAALGGIAVRRMAGFSPRLDSIVRFGAAVIPSIFGIVVRVSGIHRIPSGRALMIVSNHVNIFDGFVLQGHLPVAVRGMELDSHFEWPIYGTAMRLFGNISVPHNLPRIAVRSLRRVRSALEQGTSILSFPEGHRTRTGGLGRYMSGPFRIAHSAAAANSSTAILPVVMYAAYARKRVGSARITPGVVEIRIGRPIGPDEILSLGPRGLADRCRNEMLHLLENR